MAVGRDLAHGVALVVRGDGLHPLRAVVLEIPLLEKAPRLPAEGDHPLHQAPPVEALTAGGCQLLQSVSVLRPAEDLSRPVWGAVRLHHPLPPGAVGGRVPLHSPADTGAVQCPLDRHVHRHSHPLPGVGGRGGEQLFKGAGPEAPVELCPSPGGAGHHGGQPALFRHLPEAPLPHQGGGQSCRGHAAGVQAVQLFLPLHPNQGEAVPPDAVSCGLQQGHGGGHGHRRIHGISPGLHHIQADLGPQGDGGTGHGPAGVHHAAA